MGQRSSAPRRTENTVSPQNNNATPPPGQQQQQQAAPTAPQKPSEQQQRSLASPCVVLITGCSSGLGAALAVLLAKDADKRFKVYATMRNLDKKGALVEAGKEALDDTLFIRQLDVCSDESVAAAVEEVQQSEGRIDVLGEYISAPHVRESRTAIKRHQKIEIPLCGPGVAVCLLTNSWHGKVIFFTNRLIAVPACVVALSISLGPVGFPRLSRSIATSILPWLLGRQSYTKFIFRNGPRGSRLGGSRALASRAIPSASAPDFGSVSPGPWTVVFIRILSPTFTKAIRWCDKLRNCH